MFAFAVPFEIWAAANRPDGRARRRGSEAPLPPLRILLAEDSPDNCTITLAYLEDTPYRVEIAETGAIACEMFMAGHYDLVLMDRQMPVMDGLTATRTIRAWEKAQRPAADADHRPDGLGLKGDRETCLAAGCTAYLTKPIKQEVLLQAIREHSTIALSVIERRRRPRWTLILCVRSRNSQTGSPRICRTAGRMSSRCWTLWIG